MAGIKSFVYLFFRPKYFSNTQRNNKVLIIVCKGIQKNGVLIRCPFLHAGEWGDSNLVEHEKFHGVNSKPHVYWLGFDIIQNSGKYSGRDGKRK